MTSWIYVFSKFTPEALLFESLMIFLLGAGYAGFWIVRKRRQGAADELIPAGLVRQYLNQLIADAEQLRIQLFGLLSAAGVSHHDAARIAAGASAPAPSMDPALLQKVAQLETKMQEQVQAMENIVAEKTKIEQELAAAKAAGGAAGADTSQITELQEKISILEAKLAEYSVIEDDLANLKRLQQENAQLRTALAGKDPAAAAAIIAASSASPVTVTTPAPAPVTPVAVVADGAPAAAPSAPTPAPAAPAPEPNFEGLVNQVEQSLQTEPAAPAPAPEAAPAPAPAPEPAAAEPAVLEELPSDRSDADLVAEFEKMLNG